MQLFGTRYGVLSVLLVVPLASIASLQAQDPPQPLTVENPSDASGFVTVKYKLNKGDDLVWEVSPKPTRKLNYVEGEYAVIVLNGPSGITYTVTGDWINWDAKKRGRPNVEFTVGQLPIPPPKPVPPVPPGPVPPIPPDPKPVTSFTVFLMYDPLPNTLTNQQYGVVYGVELEKAVVGAQLGTTVGYGWRIPIDTKPELMPTALRQPWTDAQKSIVEKKSKPPILVCIPNDTIYIDDLPSTGKEAAALVLKYRGK